MSLPNLPGPYPAPQQDTFPAAQGAFVHLQKPDSYAAFFPVFTPEEIAKAENIEDKRWSALSEKCLSDLIVFPKDLANPTPQFFFDHDTPMQIPAEVKGEARYLIEMCRTFHTKLQNSTGHTVKAFLIRLFQHQCLHSINNWHEDHKPSHEYYLRAVVTLRDGQQGTLTTPVINHRGSEVLNWLNGKQPQCNKEIKQVLAPPGSATLFHLGQPDLSKKFYPLTSRSEQSQENGTIHKSPLTTAGTTRIIILAELEYQAPPVTPVPPPSATVRALITIVQIVEIVWPLLPARPL